MEEYAHLTDAEVMAAFMAASSAWADSPTPENEAAAWLAWEAACQRSDSPAIQAYPQAA